MIGILYAKGGLKYVSWDRGISLFLWNSVENPFDDIVCKLRASFWCTHSQLIESASEANVDLTKFVNASFGVRLWQGQNFTTAVEECDNLNVLFKRQTAEPRLYRSDCMDTIGI